MICDCVAIGAARALQVCPEQASIWSAVTKYFVPATLDSAMRDVSVVLGARFFLRSGHPWSMFQKMMRDSLIVGVFEGAGVVQLHTLALQLEHVTTARISEDLLRRRLKTIFSLREPLPAFDPRQLDLMSRDGCDPVCGIPLLCEQLRSLGVSDAVLKSGETVSRRYAEFVSDIGCAQGLSERPAVMPELARRCTLLHAAACSIAFWLHNREILGDFFGREEWLSDCLNRIFADRAAIAGNAAVERELVERHRHQRLFSVVPVQLALRGESAVDE
jgi:hypothetical protein